MDCARLKWSLLPYLIVATVLVFGGVVQSAKTAKGAPIPVAAIVPESVIEEVTAKQLDRLLQDKDYVAVYWCKCGTTRVSGLKSGPEKRRVSKQ